MNDLDGMLKNHGISGSLTLLRTNVWGSFYRFDVPTGLIFPVWQSLRNRVGTTGYWPLILAYQHEDRVGVSYYDIDSLDTFVQQDISPEEALDKVAQCDISAINDRIPTHEWLIHFVAEERIPLLDGHDQDDDLRYIMDPWSYVQGLSSKEYLEKLIGSALLLVPVTESWQVFLALAYGGNDRCPDPEIHASVFKEWEDRYGVELVTLSGGVVAAHATKPPADHRGALLLAWEHFNYCTDLGDHPLEFYAAKLLQRFPWIFSWK